jgi:hypothetical protein
MWVMLLLLVIADEREEAEWDELTDERGEGRNQLLLTIRTSFLNVGTNDHLLHNGEIGFHVSLVVQEEAMKMINRMLFLANLREIDEQKQELNHKEQKEKTLKHEEVETLSGGG